LKVLKIFLGVLRFFVHSSSLKVFEDSSKYFKVIFFPSKSQKINLKISMKFSSLA
jgi:hypothetical protein